MRARQVALVAGIIVVIVLIAVGVNSCESSSRKTALEHYANDVNAVMTASQHTSRYLFSVLDGTGTGSGTASRSDVQATVSQDVNDAGHKASQQLTQVEGLHPPSSVKTAHGDLVRAMQLRSDGLQAIAANIQSAYGKTASHDAIDGVAAAMARFYASDVLYKDYVAPDLVSALHAGGIQVGGDGGIPISGSQFLPSLGWLAPSTVASTLGVNFAQPSGSGSATTTTSQPGPHGHELDSVAVNGTTISPDATSTVSAQPAPSFVLSFTNSGKSTEDDVGCSVTVSGTGVSGSSVVAQTTPGQTTTCTVKLKASPPSGTYQVKATIDKVAGEKDVSNNSHTYPITFN